MALAASRKAFCAAGEAPGNRFRSASETISYGIPWEPNPDRESVDNNGVPVKVIQFSGLRLGALYADWAADGARIRERQRELLSELFAMAETTGAEVLIAAGDLFDSNHVSLAEVGSVLNLCKANAGITVVLLPGGRDPWSDYSVYRHLSLAAPPNLVVASPGYSEPREIRRDVWLYALPVDAGRAEPERLQTLQRNDQSGVHIAVAYGSMGRLQPGPEEGLVMVSPDVVGHPFDFLALADGGPAEKIGNVSRPACYAGPLVSLEPGVADGGHAWQLRLGDAEPGIEPVRLDGLRTCEMQIDITGLSDANAVALAIRREADDSPLARVELVGTRPADRLVLETAVRALCQRDFLGLQITDSVQITAPADPRACTPTLTLLWEQYSQAPAETRSEWGDALRLCAAGVTDPQSWQEAPWSAL
jgi:hypothetical protein